MIPLGIKWNFLKKGDKRTRAHTQWNGTVHVYVGARVYGQ